MTETTNSAEVQTTAAEFESIQPHDKHDSSVTAAHAQQHSLSEESNNDDSLSRNRSLMDNHNDDSEDERVEDDISSMKHTSSEVVSDEPVTSTNDSAHAFSNQAARNSPSVASLFSSSRRHTISHHTPLQQPHRWDHFVRSGTRLKTLLEDAMSEVKSSIGSVRLQKRGRDTDEDEEPDASRSRVVAVADFTAELAREKTAQVLQLQRVRTHTNKTIIIQSTSANLALTDICTFVR